MTALTPWWTSPERKVGENFFHSYLKRFSFLCPLCCPSSLLNAPTEAERKRSSNKLKEIENKVIVNDEEGAQENKTKRIAYKYWVRTTLSAERMYKKCQFNSFYRAASAAAPHSPSSTGLKNPIKSRRSAWSSVFFSVDVHCRAQHSSPRWGWNPFSRSCRMKNNENK